MKSLKYISIPRFTGHTWAMSMSGPLALNVLSDPALPKRVIELM